MRKFIQDIRQKASAHGYTAHQAPTDNSRPDHTATDLGRWTFDYFYSEENHQFQARVKSDSTFGKQDNFGYVVWPVTIMVQAMSECLAKTDKQVYVIKKFVSCFTSILESRKAWILRLEDVPWERRHILRR